MKTTLLLSISIILFLFVAIIIFKINQIKNVKYVQPEILSGKKILTIYYSNGGNTKDVAQNLHSIIGGDIKEIKLIEKYPDNVFKMSKKVREQIKEGYLPDIEYVDISNYDIIFAGSPIWSLSASLPFICFVKNNSFENKILIPFFTYSGGANKDKTFNEIKSLANTGVVKKPLFMFENGIIFKKEQITNWVNKL